MSKWIITNSSTRPSVVYHTNKDCTHIKQQDRVVEASGEYLEYHDASECQRCAGKEVAQTGDKEIYKKAKAWGAQ